MKLMETIQELVLGLSIGILLPLIAYWTVYTIEPFIRHDNVVLESLEQGPAQTGPAAVTSNNTDGTTKKLGFWIHLVFALAALIVGMCITLQTLSFGCITGGIFNLLMAIGRSYGSPALNLALFSGILLFLMVIISLKDYAHMSSHKKS
jgi:hypothetical protein